MFSGYTSAEAGGWASAFPEIVSAVLSPARVLIRLTGPSLCNSVQTTQGVDQGVGNHEILFRQLHIDARRQQKSPRRTPLSPREFTAKVFAFPQLDSS